MTEKEVLEQIEQAARDGGAELDLSNQGIKTLPAEIGKLTNLNELTSGQLETLKQIYLDLDVPSDEFLFDPNLMRKVARRFEGLTGTRYDAPILIAAIVAKRKRGLWVKIREPFADVEAIVDDTA
jgi:hypothetical protein